MALDWKDALGALRADLPEAEENIDNNDESAETSSADAREKLHIVVERKGRRGKTATIIEGFTCDDDTLQETARVLKQRIGTGGSARGGEILLQGEWKEKAAEILRSMGHSVK